MTFGLDDDGYPTEETLETIRTWKGNYRDLLENIEEIWTYKDYWSTDGIATTPRPNIYAISTGGWSGNEDIIGALADNTMFWLMCLVSYTRGGHYVFEV